MAQKVERAAVSGHVPMPETGSQRNRMAKSRTRIRPSQNGGALPASRAADHGGPVEQPNARASAANRPTQ